MELLRKMLSQEKKLLAKGSWHVGSLLLFTITLDFVTATFVLAPVFSSHIPTYIKAIILLAAGGGVGAGCAVGVQLWERRGTP